MSERALDPTFARLICLSDAGTHAGSVVFYIGYKLKGRGYSNQVLTSKSKLMAETIPRNELNAVLLMTEIVFFVVRALQGLIKEIIYLNASTIAIARCLNTDLKLQLYVKSRPETVRQMIQWTDLASEGLPLLHIDRAKNIADILTKYLDIDVADLGQDSEWWKS